MARQNCWILDFRAHIYSLSSLCFYLCPGIFDICTEPSRRSNIKIPDSSHSYSRWGCYPSAYTLYLSEFPCMVLPPFTFVAIFHLDTITKKNNLTYHILNATRTFFCWSSNILTRNSSLLVLFIVIAHANSKYSYHLWTFSPRCGVFYVFGLLFSLNTKIRSSPACSRKKFLW